MSPRDLLSVCSVEGVATDHRLQLGDDVLVHQPMGGVLQSVLGVELSVLFDLLLLFLLLLGLRLGRVPALHVLREKLRHLDHLLHLLQVVLTRRGERDRFEALAPVLPVHTVQHLLLPWGQLVVRGQRVVLGIQALHLGRNRGLHQVAEVAGHLAGLAGRGQRTRIDGHLIDGAEGLEHDFPFHRLDGVDNDGHRAGVEGLEGLLGVDIDGRQPTAEAWMRVVPKRGRDRDGQALTIRRPSRCARCAEACRGAWSGRRGRPTRR